MKIKNFKIFHFKKIDSTNAYAKNIASEVINDKTIIVADKQTAGRGRLGRTFISNRGGLYFSIILNPEKSAQDTVFITVAAAVAVARAIESISQKKCDIKWVNDIYIENKKVCGILTEGVFDNNGKIKSAILGVGINLFETREKFPKNVPLADSIFHKGDKILFKNCKRKQLLKEFLKEFFKFYYNLEKKEYMDEYKKKSFLKGKKITYVQDDKNYIATVKDIDNNANLIVVTQDKEEVLSHGEIQIIGMEQLPV